MQPLTPIDGSVMMRSNPRMPEDGPGEQGLFSLDAAPLEAGDEGRAISAQSGPIQWTMPHPQGLLPTAAMTELWSVDWIDFANTESAPDPIPPPETAGITAEIHNQNQSFEVDASQQIAAQAVSTEPSLTQSWLTKSTQVPVGSVDVLADLLPDQGSHHAWPSFAEPIDDSFVSPTLDRGPQQVQTDLSKKTPGSSLELGTVDGTSSTKENQRRSTPLSSQDPVSPSTQHEQVTDRLTLNAKVPPIASTDPMGVPAGQAQPFQPSKTANMPAAEAARAKQTSTAPFEQATMDSVHRDPSSQHAASKVGPPYMPATRQEAAAVALIETRSPVTGEVAKLAPTESELRAVKSVNEIKEFPLSVGSPPQSTGVPHAQSDAHTHPILSEAANPDLQSARSASESVKNAATKGSQLAASHPEEPPEHALAKPATADWAKARAAQADLAKQTDLSLKSLVDGSKTPADSISMGVVVTQAASKITAPAKTRAGGPDKGSVVHAIRPARGELLPSDVTAVKPLPLTAHSAVPSAEFTRTAGFSQPPVATQQPSLEGGAAAQQFDLSSGDSSLSAEALRSDGIRSDPANLRHAAQAGGSRTTPTDANLLAQFSQRLRDGDDQSFEIELHPRELGRVRFQMRPTAEGLTVQISTDRADTQDLVRRHLDDFARELRSFGHGSVAFGFSGSGHRSAEGWSSRGARSAQEARVEEASIPRTPSVAAWQEKTGVDIRV